MRTILSVAFKTFTAFLFTLALHADAFAATQTSIAFVTPSVIGANTTPVMSFSGAVASPTTAVAFIPNGGNCSSGASRVGETTLNVSDTAALGTSISGAGPYFVCYTEDGASWFQQVVSAISVVQATPTSITEIDPSAIVENSTPYMDFIGAAGTPTTKIAFAPAGNCSSPGARQGETAVMFGDANYLGSGISPPGLYSVCYTTDDVVWVAQSLVNLVVTGSTTTTDVISFTTTTGTGMEGTVTTTSSSTTTTLPPQPIDDYNCYKAKDLRNPRFARVEDMGIADQFAIVTTGKAVKPFLVCAPAEVAPNVGLLDPSAYQCCYKLSAPALSPAVKLATTDVFGSLELEIKKPKVLCRPCDVSVLP